MECPRAAGQRLPNAVWDDPPPSPAVGEWADLPWDAVVHPVSFDATTHRDGFVVLSQHRPYPS